ncbi:recombinase family protein [Leekyejoonella antrihumi]|uniref:Recombinase family protein n=1 Tax=Leekyejoonella antrihumi TaxID=1660198 RepID=A0A563DTH5_9MICO|nr:recombinase family protein [Leekyejoonella antrihumi]TWP33545.1 recombinase family protein [Leekyejoonella antrihumi]
MKFGYTRISTRDKQVDDLQRRALVEVGVGEDHIYSDQVSGSKKASTRPGWSDLEVRLRPSDELVVWRIDRIGRSMIDVITTVNDLIERNVVIRSLSDGIDPSTREGQLMLNLIATFAEYERGLIRERVQGGVDAAKARGVKLGRPAADPDELARKVRTVQHLVTNEEQTVADAARMVGWSRATYYRHHKAVGSETTQDFTG